MTDEEINKEAFELVSLIETTENKKHGNKAELIGSAKERGFLDWSDILAGNGIEKSLNQADEPITIYQSFPTGKVGLNEINYPKFQILIRSIQGLEYFKNKASFDFIEKKAFDWLLKIHSTNVATTPLLNFLKDEIESNISEYIFYFPVINLEIDNSFKVGNVEFTFFTKEYFDDLFKTLQKSPTPMTEKEFEEIFLKEYQGQVLAKVSIRSEREFAESLAQKECSLAIDVLKIYGLTPTIPEKKTMFDLNFRLNYQVKLNYLSQEVNKSDSLSLNLKFNNPPFEVTSQQLAFADNNGLQSFSHFITLDNDDELYKLIIQAIGMFGSSLSNWDLHLRIINLITILESLLLKDEEDYKMEQKVKARLSKLITDDTKEQEKLKSLFTNIYKIRHKMVHKAIKLHVDSSDLMTAQITIINVLLKLMRHNIVDKYLLKATIVDTLCEEKS